MKEDTRSSGIRARIFEWLREKVIEYDDVLPYHVLKNGFQINGESVPLVGPTGIWKPKAIRDFPISITTSPDSPYNDAISGDTLNYRYRGTNPRHPDNIRLKEAMKEKIPVIYFLGIVKGKYLAHFPVFIVGANDAALTFSVETDLSADQVWNNIEKDKANDPLVDDIKKRYAASQVLVRLHQKTFREKVLIAYREHCAFCQLRHRVLLDAAHIISDNKGGEPIVKNGISLCKIHHAAFDKNILGINEDYYIEVRKDVLEEIDGPMLIYGLQKLNHKKILLPGSRRNQPDKEFIRKRYEEFLKVG